MDEKGLITLGTLSDVGDAIREQLGTETEYLPSEMPAAIRSIQGGGGSAVLEPLSVTANGDYYPGSGVDGFDSVHVAVPGGGGAVVQPLSVTENGTYSPPSGVDGYAPVTVNVQGGGPVVSDNDILFHFNEDFRNSGSCPAVFSNVQGLTISDEQSKFGGYSLKCGTAQRYNNVALEPGFAFADADFTIDFWVYPTNLPASTNFVAPFACTYRSLGIYMRTTGMQFGLAKSNSSWYNVDVVDIAINNNEWHHIAFVRDGVNVYGFFDGRKVKTVVFGTDALAPITAMTVGSSTYSDGDGRFQGYIDELRVKIGQAVWTSDFTPPIEPYV